MNMDEFKVGDVVAVLNDESYPTEQIGDVIAVDPAQPAVAIHWRPFVSHEFPIEGEWQIAKVAG